MKRFRRILSSILAFSILMGTFSLSGSAMAQESAIDSQTVLATGTAVGDTYEAPETPRQQINFNPRVEIQEPIRHGRYRPGFRRRNRPCV